MKFNNEEILKLKNEYQKATSTSNESSSIEELKNYICIYDINFN